MAWGVAIGMVGCGILGEVLACSSSFSWEGSSWRPKKAKRKDMKAMRRRK